jgi:hypothetical protein
MEVNMTIEEICKDFVEAGFHTYPDGEATILMTPAGTPRTAVALTLNVDGNSVEIWKIFANQAPCKGRKKTFAGIEGTFDHLIKLFK